MRISVEDKFNTVQRYLAGEDKTSLKEYAGTTDFTAVKLISMILDRSDFSYINFSQGSLFRSSVVEAHLYQAILLAVDLRDTIGLSYKHLVTVKSITDAKTRPDTQNHLIVTLVTMIKAQQLQEEAAMMLYSQYLQMLQEANQELNMRRIICARLIAELQSRPNVPAQLSATLTLPPPSQTVTRASHPQQAPLTRALVTTPPSPPNIHPIIPAPLEPHQSPHNWQPCFFPASNHLALQQARRPQENRIIVADDQHQAQPGNPLHQAFTQLVDLVVSAKTAIIDHLQGQQGSICEDFCHYLDNTLRDLRISIDKISRRIMHGLRQSDRHYCLSVLNSLISQANSLLKTYELDHKVTDPHSKIAIESEIKTLTSAFAELELSLSPPKNRVINASQRKQDRLVRQQQRLLRANSSNEPNDIVNAFNHLLTDIRRLTRELSLTIPSIFVSYAWPTEHNLHEAWVQPYLKDFCHHLLRAGITTYLDIKDSNWGYSTNKHMERINQCQFVILVGTESLGEKELGRCHMIHTELNYIRRARAEAGTDDTPNIIPILLSGDYNDAFPADFVRYTAIENVRDRGYLLHMRELIRFLLFGHNTHERYDRLWDDFLLQYQHIIEQRAQTQTRSAHSGADAYSQPLFIQEIDSDDDRIPTPPDDNRDGEACVIC